MALEYYAQQQTLELLLFFKKMCDVHELNYSLGFGTLYGAYKVKGFLKSNHSADIMMPLKDYNKFISVCEKELKPPHYVFNYQSAPGEKILYIQLKKRSKVRLPEERKADETYYDYNIDIYPLVPVADTREQYMSCLEEYIYNNTVVSTNTIGMKLNYAKTKYFRKVVVPLLLQNKGEAFEKLLNMVNVSETDAKYVLIPLEFTAEHPKMNILAYSYNRRQSRGCVCEHETYKEYTTLEFEGHSFSVIKRYEQWLQAYYYLEYYEDVLENRKGDLILLHGHEERRRMQLVQMDIILEVKRICQKHDIKFSMISGTLLGAVRHKGYIPWDYDADLVFLKKEYDKFLAVLEEELDTEKYYFSGNNKDINIHNVYGRLGRKSTNYAIYEERLNPDKEGITIDLFPLHDGSDKYLGNKIQTILCNHVFKPMSWANARGKALPLTMKNLYYKLVRFVPLKWSYGAYMFFASMYKDKNTKSCSWLITTSNPLHTYVTTKKTYEELMDMEFEGYMLPSPMAYKEVLVDIFGEEYMDLPICRKRYSHAPFYHMDVGNLEIDITSGLGEEVFE